jgi:NAD(P)-dependent dehydrogenase (short-subunit alcohol dehydrogenase family)
VSADRSAPGAAGLAAGNGAVQALVPSLAVELAPVRVNAVSPGVIDTPWWSWLPDDQRGAVLAQYAERSPAGRVGTPEEVAAAIVGLMTNGFLTGVVLHCDGGLRHG